MLKKYLSYLVILNLLLFMANKGYCDDNKNLINDVLNKTTFQIDEMFQFKAARDIKVYIRDWNKTEVSCYNKFPNEEKRIQIQHTCGIFSQFILNSNISCNFLLANFKNGQDAELGRLDQFGLSSMPEYKTLFLGESIEGATIYGRKYTTQGIVYFIYKNCVCRFTFSKLNKSEELQKEELQKIDNFIKLIVRIIDISGK